MRDYSDTEELFRAVVSVTSLKPDGSPAGNTDTIVCGPYTKKGTASGVASQKAGWYIRENEYALDDHEPMPYDVKVTIQRTECKWEDA